MRGAAVVNRHPPPDPAQIGQHVPDRADVMLISVAEYESMQETLDILSDEEALADLRQSREDFAVGDTFDAGQVRDELERRRRGTS